MLKERGGVKLPLIWQNVTQWLWAGHKADDKYPIDLFYKKGDA